MRIDADWKMEIRIKKRLWISLNVEMGRIIMMM
jgi:hypothetical protein